MGLETATYIAQLEPLNPTGSDQRSTADDHSRLIKAVLQAQFPNFSATSVDATVAELNLLAGYVGATIPEFSVAQGWTGQQVFLEASLTNSVTVSWDLSVAQTARLAADGVVVLDNPSNMTGGGTYILRITNQSSATTSISFGTAYLFNEGVIPVLTKSLSAVDIISFYSDGTNMYGIQNKDFK